jgi:nitrile hydratase subunit alpha
MSDTHDHDYHNAPPSEPAQRVKAIESLLVEKGLIDPALLEELIDTYERKIGPRNGARVIAHAWVDPAYRKRLFENAAAAIEELGFPPGPQGEHMMVVENTPRVHNMVVCTLCSCYPWSVLGLPPVWYKSPAYRARAVGDPRGLLKELGVDIADKEVRVWDSSSEMRYLVMPERPAGTEGFSEDELAELVTRDSMIGTAVVKAPSRRARGATRAAR